MVLLLLVAFSIFIVFSLEHYFKTHPAPNWFKEFYSHSTCRSFILDFLILLPLIGLLIEIIARRLTVKAKNRECLLRKFFYCAATVILWVATGLCYFDLFDCSFASSFLGHPEAWGGNHYMWNSGIEILGLEPFIDTTVPTYKNFWGPMNILAMILFALYPFVLYGSGKKLYSLFFKKETIKNK